MLHMEHRITTRKGKPKSDIVIGERDGRTVF